MLIQLFLRLTGNPYRKEYGCSNGLELAVSCLALH